MCKDLEMGKNMAHSGNSEKFKYVRYRDVK